MISLYWPPLQAPDQFDKFLSHLSIHYKVFLKLEVPLFSLCEINCRNLSWSLGDPSSPPRARVWSFNIFLWIATASQCFNTSSKFGYLYWPSVYQPNSHWNGKWFPQFSMYPLDIAHKLNAHKAFRRRPGGLLNVLG